MLSSDNLAQTMTLLENKSKNLNHRSNGGVMVPVKEIFTTEKESTKRKYRAEKEEEYSNDVEYVEIMEPTEDSSFLTKVLAAIISYIRSCFYAQFFSHRNAISTQHGYFNILKKVEEGSKLLDVGCGDGIYFTNKNVVKLIKQKGIKIFAIDVDAGAVEICKKRINKNGLQNHVFAEAKSVELVKSKYDYVLWMESYPVIDMTLFERIFTHSLSLCQNKCFLYHNLLQQPSPLMTLWKPLIYYFTSVDFGRATTVGEMRIIMKGITNHKFQIKPLISCKAYEMLSSQLKSLAPFVPLLNKEITQYLIVVEIDQVSQVKSG